MTQDENAELDAIAIANDAKQGERILQKVYAFIGRFISYPSQDARVAHTLWLVHTHMMDDWENTPRIAFLSPEPGSGKSRALEISEMLVPNPILTCSTTPAYLFRRVGAEGGCTILYDEIDAVFGPKAKANEETRALLNAGYRKGATAGRCVIKGKTIETEEISAFSAVALAGLGWLPDTIQTRSVVIRMRKRHEGEAIEDYRTRLHKPEGQKLCSQIDLWCRSIPRPIDWPELPEGVVDRDADIWEPLIAIADIAGGEWPERARKAAVSMVAASKDKEPTLGVRLLADLKTVFASTQHMPTKLILEKLHDLPEAPWRDLKGKPLDDRGLARRLRDYNVKSKDIRTGEAVFKGYDRADFVDAWRRYVDRPSVSPASATTATSATNPINGQSGVAHVAPVALPGISGEAACHHCGKDGNTFEASCGGISFFAHRECLDACMAELNGKPHA